jgi:hypothetical protein
MILARVLVCLTVLLPGVAMADVSGAMRFALMRECKAEQCTEVALGVGSINTHSGQALQRFLDTYPQVRKVYFHSPGGDLATGLEMGMLLRRQGLDSAVSPKMKCFSACAYTFIGGSTRTVEPGGLIGVHRFYTKDGTGNVEDGQQAQATLVRYVRDMGVSESLVELSLQAGADEMMGIGAAKARVLRVDNAHPSPSSWSLSPHKGRLMANTEGYSLGWDTPTSLVIDSQTSTGSVNALMMLRSPMVDSLTPPKLEGARLQLCAKEQCLEGSNKKPWFRDEDQDWIGVFELDPIRLHELLDAQESETMTVVVTLESGKTLRMPTDLDGLRTIMGSTRNVAHVSNGGEIVE